MTNASDPDGVLTVEVAMTDQSERVSEERIDAMLDDLIHCVRSHERSPDKYTADEIMIARRVIKDELLALRSSSAQSERDAARFLWLDEYAPVVTAKPEGDYCVWAITFHSSYGLKADECDLDAAIDAAMSTPSAGGG